MNGTGLHILRKWTRGGCKPAENCHLRISTYGVHRVLYINTTPNLLYIFFDHISFNCLNPNGLENNTQPSTQINGVNAYREKQ